MTENKKNNYKKKTTGMPGITKEKSQFISQALPLAAILLLSFLLYLKSFQNGFTNYDDDVLIINNPLAQGISINNLIAIFSTFINGMYHPLVTLSWSIEKSIFGIGYTHYHVINLLFHLLNIWLVYRFVLLLKGKLNIAFIVALIFAVHPMISESVLWLSERKDLLCTAFILGGLIHYLKYLKNDFKRKYIILTLVFFILALLSKPLAIVFPLLLMVIDYFNERKINLNTLFEKLPFFAFSLSFGIIAILAARSVEGINTLADYSIVDRIFFVSYALLFYAFKLIIPVGLSAKHFYPLLHHGMLPIVYYFSFIVFLVVIYLVIKYVKNNRVIIGGFLFYLAGISIILPILPVGDTVVAERYSYVSYIGLLLIVGYLYDQFKDYKFIGVAYRYFFNALIFLYVILFIYLTFLRIDAWKSPVKLWSDVIEKDNKAVLAYVARGDYYTLSSDYEKALKDYSKAITVDSTYAVAYNNRGYIYLKKEKYQEALKDFNNAIELSPKFSKAYYNRSCLYVQTEEYDSAITDCNITLSFLPDYANAYYNRAMSLCKIQRYNEALTDINKAISMGDTMDVCYYCRGLIYFETNEYQLALADLNKSLDINQALTDARYTRAKCYKFLQQYDKAIDDLNTILQEKPGNPMYLCYLGDVKYQKKEYEDALSDINFVIENAKDYAPAYYERALINIAIGNTSNVCNDFKKASELDFNVDKNLIEKYCR